MTERRRLQRFRIRCPVSLWKPGDGTFTPTVTENLTCDSFYCLSDEEYSPGEQLEATLEVPAKMQRGAVRGALVLQCIVEVVRMDGSPRTGIACRIKDYVVVAPKSSHERDSKTNRALTAYAAAPRPRQA